MSPGTESATLRIAATPEQVRTARLVAGAAARKAGLDADQIEDVRLAVSEACNRALVRQQAAGVDAMLTIVLAEYDDAFVVEVFDGAGLESSTESSTESSADSGVPASDGVGAPGDPESDAQAGPEPRSSVGEAHLGLESEALAEMLLTSLVPGASVEGPVTRVRWERESTPAIG